MVGLPCGVVPRPETVAGVVSLKAARVVTVGVDDAHVAMRCPIRLKSFVDGLALSRPDPADGSLCLFGVAIQRPKYSEPILCRPLLVEGAVQGDVRDVGRHGLHVFQG